MKTLAIIPARGGSKRLPGKNLVAFHGKPLIAWTVEAALQTRRFDCVMVSTDSSDIADAARKAGAEVPRLRPADLSGDDATSLAVVLHVLEFLQAETVALLQPTSPLRTSADINECLDLHVSTGKPVISVKRIKWVCSVDRSRSLTLLNKDYVVPTGAVYVASAVDLRAGRTWWDEAVGCILPEERSVDVDTVADLEIAKALFLSQGRSTHEEMDGSNN